MVLQICPFLVDPLTTFHPKRARYIWFV